MNPLVKNIFVWLTETILFCLLETFFEVFIHNWNRFIEVFNWNRKPFDIECLFGVSNVFDTATLYDDNDFIHDVITDNLIALDDACVYTPSSAQDCRLSEHSASKEDCKLAGDSSIYDKIEENMKNDDMNNYEFAEIQGVHNDYLSIPVDTLNENSFLGAMHNFSVCVKDNLHYKEKEVDAICNDSTAKYSNIEDKFTLENVSNVDITEYKGNINLHPLEFYEPSGNKQQKCQYLNSSLDTTNENICLTDKNAHDFQNPSIHNKYKMEFEVNDFFSLYDDFNKSTAESKTNLCTAATESKCNFFNDEESEKITGETFSLPSNNITEEKDKGETEALFSTMVNESAYHSTLKTRSKQNYEDEKILYEDKIVLSSVIPDYFVEDEENIKFRENPNSDNLKCEVKKESGENVKDTHFNKKVLHFKDEVEVFTFDPFSSRNVSSENLDKVSTNKVLMNENTFTDDIVDRILQPGYQSFNQDCDGQKFPNPDIDNFVDVGKAKLKYWPKYNLSFHLLGKKKSEQKSKFRKNMDLPKGLSWKAIKTDYKSIKDKFLPNIFNK